MAGVTHSFHLHATPPLAFRSLRFPPLSFPVCCGPIRSLRGLCKCGNFALRCACPARVSERSDGKAWEDERSDPLPGPGRPQHSGSHRWDFLPLPHLLFIVIVYLLSVVFIMVQKDTFHTSVMVCLLDTQSRLCSWVNTHIMSQKIGFGAWSSVSWYDIVAVKQPLCLMKHETLGIITPAILLPVLCFCLLWRMTNSWHSVSIFEFGLFA